MDSLHDSDGSNSVKNYLGYDFSTQQVKAIIINDDCEVIHESSVQFDSDLPEFRTAGGVNVHKDGVTVTSSPVMWIKAFDMLMDRLRIAGANFCNIVAISGSAQQHGSVYWKKGASEVLSNLEPNRFLHDQLSNCFSIYESPVWMDSSTPVYCRRLEEIIGGPMELADITGSRAYERFTGNQIAKIFIEKKDCFINTERISLVSSFVCSLLIGSYAPIDYSDASGMNLLDIRTKTWNKKCLDACGGPELQHLLGDPVPTGTQIGIVCDYFVHRYDFNPNCAVVQFTGDNPSSLAGMRMDEGDVVVSLGTSDTLFLWLREPRPSEDGHVFINPVSVESFMALLCFKNGSLTREKIRDDCADGSWDLFSQILDVTPKGNFGNIGFYYHCREIMPEIEGVYRFNKFGEPVDRFTSNEVEVRAVVESQCLAKRYYAQKLGLNLGYIQRILATGGASANLGILQVLSDVFNKPVYTMTSTNSACLGAAFRAKHVVSGCSFREAVNSPDFSLVCKPHAEAPKIYDPLLEKFSDLLMKLK